MNSEGFIALVATEQSRVTSAIRFEVGSLGRVYEEVIVPSLLAFPRWSRNGSQKSILSVYDSDRVPAKLE